MPTTGSADSPATCACGKAGCAFASWWVPIHTDTGCWLQSGEARIALAGKVDGVPPPPWYRRAFGGASTPVPADADRECAAPSPRSDGPEGTP